MVENFGVGYIINSEKFFTYDIMVRYVTVVITMVVIDVAGQQGRRWSALSAA